MRDPMRDSNLDAAYDIEASVPDLPAIQARYAEASAALTGLRDAALDLAYGPDPRHRLDIFAPPEGARAAILYFHGGYWKAGAKEGRRFPRPGLECPRHRLGSRGIPPRACARRSMRLWTTPRRAVSWFHAHAADHGCDPSAIHVAGNSAGGHLARHAGGRRLAGRMVSAGRRHRVSRAGERAVRPVALAPHLRERLARPRRSGCAAQQPDPSAAAPQHARRRRLGRRGNRQRFAASRKPMRRSARGPAPR